MKLYSAMYGDWHPMDMFFPQATCVVVSKEGLMDEPGFLILHGGADIDPALYKRGRSSKSHHRGFNGRDDIEMALIREAQNKIYSVDNIDYSAYYNEELSVRFNEEFREGDNVDDVKALVFLQSVEGFSESKNLIDSRYSTAIDLNVNEFLHDFNKMLLKDPILNDVFAFTSKGLEAE